MDEPSPANVVLLHGQPGDRSDWDVVVSALPPHIRALALDRPGYRDNPLAPGTMADNARWLIDELDRAGIDKAILVGHSYAGGVALTTALLAPERVSGLVLIASIGPDCLNGWDRLMAAPVVGPAISIGTLALTPPLIKKVLTRIERKRKRSLEPDEYLYWGIWANSHHKHGAVWRTFLVEQRDMVANLAALDAQLGSIQVPTLILADPRDQVVPAATAHALHDRLPKAELELVSGGGHHLPRSRPAVVAAAITRFAASL